MRGYRRMSMRGPAVFRPTDSKVRTFIAPSPVATTSAHRAPALPPRFAFRPLSSSHPAKHRHATRHRRIRSCGWRSSVPLKRLRNLISSTLSSRAALRPKLKAEHDVDGIRERLCRRVVKIRRRERDIAQARLFRSWHGRMKIQGALSGSRPRQRNALSKDDGPQVALGEIKRYYEEWPFRPSRY